MAGVFLSYDRDDTDKARPIALALEKAGHSVWWDLHVRGGAQFGKVIEEALKAADAVVVLWSRNSVESAWVRDEAAAGRDSGRLVPVTIDGTQPPLGFRQFQTIDLRVWRARSKGKFALLLEAVESLGPKENGVDDRPPDRPPSSAGVPQHAARWLLAAGALALLVCAGLGWWLWSARNGLPVVQVAAADNSPASRATANDLYVKLGSLAQIGKGQWQLVDAMSGHRRPDLVFRAADTGSAGQPDPNVVLLDGKDNSLLWSREFSAPGAREADLRQQMSLTAGRVLGCALEARADGGLRRDLFKIFLDGCAQLAEESQVRPEKAASTLRAVVAGKPRFAPGWARLLIADTNVLANAGTDEQKRQLQQDIREAAKVAPDLPQIIIAQTYLLPATAHAKLLDLLTKAKAQAPDKPEIYSEEVTALSRVGRMSDAIASARRAAELDPLSPTTETQLIMTLAHGGLVEEAHDELKRAEKTWAGTGALRDAEFGFNLRYGDARAALKMQSSGFAQLDDLFIRAREDPSPQNIEALARWFKPFLAKHDPSLAGVAVQALGQFHQTDDVLQWLAMVPTPTLAEAFSVLFRPYLADVRRDPRFMLVAKRAGMIDYWRSSDHWPDFCFDPQLPYDCKAEAAKLS